MDSTNMFKYTLDDNAPETFTKQEMQEEINKVLEVVNTLVTNMSQVIKMQSEKLNG